METGINVKLKFFPLAWFLFFCTPVVEINGQKNKRPWGKHYFELEPGIYNVKIYFPYIMKRECGANRVDVNLKEGQVRDVSFYMPPWMLSKGRMKVT